MMRRTTKANMARDQRDDMDAEKRTQSLHDLELKHHKSAAEGVLLVKDEDVRRLRVRILLLKDENTTLRDEIEMNNSKNTTLTAQCDNLKAEIEAKIDAVRLQEKQLRKHEREYSNLKAELQSMNNVNENSANVLAEKLALSRELSILKPELEHLRSQVNHQQATLAEKLALERQVTTLEVELANEKKATRRAMQSRESNDRVEDDLRKKLRELEKKLTAETAARERLEDQLEQSKRTHEMALQDQDSTRELETDLRKKLQEAQRQLRDEKEEKERVQEELQSAKHASKKAQQAQVDNAAEDGLRAQLEESETKFATLQKKYYKLEQEHETMATEVESRNEQFEKRVVKMKTKYREVQEELKKCQKDLAKVQQQQARAAKAEDTKMDVAKTAAFRKRKAQEMASGDFTNIEIQTPSAEDATRGRKAKKPTFEPKVVEKSTFSITPFLNRSKEATEEASKMDDVEDSILGPQSASSRSTRSPAEQPPPTEAAEPSEPEPAKTAPVETEEPKPVQKARGRPKKVLADAPSAKQNAIPQGTKKKVLKQKKNVESSEDAVAAAAPQPQGEAAEKTMTVRFNDSVQHEDSNASSLTDEPKKRKRKVLGSTKTLFDEDDGEVPAAARKPVAKVPLGAKRVVSKAPLGGAQRNAFAGTASFSPLKRDRRGVGASFLA
ncbi:hypothetical protein F5Y18DRAFT_369005 [Xylariaceae sp. FL1019]|nr:hypothetical protein F5Y18DRAFT_369005 [Xylariaceae sp. FL1019]